MIKLKEKKNMYVEPEMIVIPCDSSDVDMDRGCQHHGLYCSPPAAFFALCSQELVYNVGCATAPAHCLSLNAYSD